MLAALLSLSLTLNPTWRSELYPADWDPDDLGAFYEDKLIQDFSHAGYAAGERPIPDVAGPVFDVTDFGATADDEIDDTRAIRETIAAASTEGGVVYLPAGLYRVAPPGDEPHALLIDASNVVLRGDGPGETFLLNTRTDMNRRSVIMVRPAEPRPWHWDDDAGERITTDLPRPTRVIPLADPSGFAVGDDVLIRQTLTPEFAAEHQSDKWLDRGPRGVTFLRTVTAVTPEGIEVDAPMRYALFTRDDARVRPATPMLSEVGVESLSIGNVEIADSPAEWEENRYTEPGTPEFDAHASWLVKFDLVTDGWIRDVDSFAAAGNANGSHMLSNGLNLQQTRHVTIQDCDLQRTQYGGGGGNGYLFRLEGNDCLVVDSTATFSRHGFVFSHMRCSGNVLLRCHDRDTARSVGGSPTGYETNGRGSDHHMWLSPSNLADSCRLTDSFFAAYYRPYANHMSPAAHSVFWNTTADNERFDYAVHSHQSFYGYVIGTAGSTPGVNVDPVHDPVTPAMAAPVDHVEGIGEAATLEPQSLYEDQLRRRLKDTQPAANGG